MSQLTVHLVIFAVECMIRGILIDFASPLAGTKAIFEKYGNRQNLNEFFNQLSVLYGTPLIERKSFSSLTRSRNTPRPES